jgi:hypothetical protein
MLLSIQAYASTKIVNESMWFVEDSVCYKVTADSTVGGVGGGAVGGIRCD